MRSFTSSNTSPRRAREPLAPESRRIEGAFLGERLPGLTEPELVRLRELLDLAQAKHVRQRPSGRDEVRIGRRAKVPCPHGQRAARQRNRPEIVLEGGTVTTLARRLGKDDALA